jgi:hypothetical protein
MSSQEFLGLIFTSAFQEGYSFAKSMPVMNDLASFMKLGAYITMREMKVVSALRRRARPLPFASRSGIWLVEPIYVTLVPNT